MAPMKRKSSASEDVRPSKPKAKDSGDRPHKRTKSDASSSLSSTQPKSVPSKEIKKASTKLSVLREEEPAFPRGGASVLTSLEQKQIRIEATQDVLFEQSTSKQKADGEMTEEDDASRPTTAASSKRSKKTKTAAKKGKISTELVEPAGVKIEGLSYNRIVPGSIILGQVSKINTHDVELALPNNLTGFIPITNISKALSARLQKLLEDDPDEEAESGPGPEGAASEDDEDVDLEQIMSVGQYLRARVVSTTDEASANGVAKGKKRLILSVIPAEVNAGLARSDVVVNNVVQASVISVEDHGLVMDIGLDDNPVQGFMLSNEVGHGVVCADIEIGAVFLCLVMGESANGNIVRLSADSQRMGNIKKTHYLTSAPTIDAFLPGVAVEILITELTHAGLAGQVMGSLDVTADMVHSGADTDVQDLEKRFKIGQKVKARVICTFPSLEIRKLGISLLDHVLSLSGLQVTIGSETEKVVPTTALALSTILPEVKVTRVHPGVGLFVDLGIYGVPGFVHISRIADKKIEGLLETTGPYRIGSLHAARVIGYNAMDRLFLISMEEHVLQQTFLRVDDVPVGAVVKGTVEKLLVNAKGLLGALVNLSEGISGLVPEIHLADVKLSHPEKKFREGLSVKARVLSTDIEKRQIRLTLKKSLVNSDGHVFRAYEEIKPGMECPGTIVSILSSGAIVQFYGPVRALLPVAEMSEAFIRDPNEHFRVGQVVHVRVLSVDADLQKMIVSCRSPGVLSDDQLRAREELQIGTLVTGKVVEKSKDDVVVELDGSGLRSVLVLGHLTDGSEQRNESALKKIRVGQKLEDLLVLSKDENQKSVVVSNKPSLVGAAKSGALIKSLEDVKEGEVVKGFVNNVTLVGVFVQFAGSMTGLLLKRHVSEEATKLPDFGMRRLQSISATVLTVDQGQRRFLLTMKELEKSGTTEKGAKQTGAVLLDRSVTNPVDPEITSVDDYSVGKLTKGRIKAVKLVQINVQLADKVFARIDVSNLFDSLEEIPDAKRPMSGFKAKDVIDVRVMGDHDTRNHRFLAITHRKSFIPCFELSAKGSDLAKAPAQIVSMDRMQVGSSWLAFVNNVRDDFIWVTISPLVRGRIAYLDLTDDISQLKDVESHFPVGSALKVHVTGVDLETNRLDLSLRPKSSSSVEGYGGLSKGLIITGQVTKVQERGLCVHINATASGVVGLTDLVDDYDTANPTIYKKNEIVRVCVKELDIPNKRVFLSIRPSRVLNSSLPVRDRDISSITELKVNDIVRGFVKNVADNGLYVSLGGLVTGYVRVSDLFDAFVKDWKSRFQVDQLVKGKVIAIDLTLNHVLLSLKGSVVDKDYTPPLTLKDMKEGQIVTGKIRKVEDFGVFILVDGTENVSGLCHRSEISDERVQDVKKVYAEGDVVKAKVLTVNKSKNRISFGLKMSYFKDDSNGDEDDAMGGVDTVDVDDEDDEDRDSEDSNDSNGGVDLDAVKDMESDADDTSPALATRDIALHQKTSTAQLPTSGFDWTASTLDTVFNKRALSSSPSATSPVPTSKRKKSRTKTVPAPDLTGDLDAHGPQSSSDYERLLLTQPDSSLLWLQYMAFHLQLGEIDQARSTAERALHTINLREETEKFNVWIAMLNLENTYGNEATLEAVFQRACASNDPREVHERLISILIQSGKHSQASSHLTSLTKTHSTIPTVWLNHATFLFNTTHDPQAARALLPRALQCLAAHSHLSTTSKFAALEFRSPAGDPERGRTLFEGLIATWPRKWDLWGILLDLEISRVGREAKVSDKASEGQKASKDSKQQTTEAVDGIRKLFQRVLGCKGLKDKTARSFFRKWVAFEEGLGAKRGQVEEVKRKAGEWVRRRGEAEESGKTRDGRGKEGEDEEEEE